MQNYQNHVRYYAPHHFFFYPVVLTCAAISLWQYFQDPELKMIWLAIFSLFLLLAWLSYMLRQHYALMNQNRVVRLEMRYRYYMLTTQRFEPLEPQLSFGQIAALRFASDEELLSLIDQTINKKLSPGEIKKSIQRWLPDDMRV